MKQCARDPHLDCTGPKEKTGGGSSFWLYVRLKLGGGHGDCSGWKCWSYGPVVKWARGFVVYGCIGEVRVRYLVVMAYHGKLDEAENLPQEESGGVRWGS